MGRQCRSPAGGATPAPSQRSCSSSRPISRASCAEFDLPLRFRGTPFQERVWNALADIPYGETRSYGEIAALVGAPEASRAVGLAAGKNPLPIVLPCHRVIGSNGQLTGFGGGLPTKTFLLRLEGNKAGAPSAQLSLL